MSTWGLFWPWPGDGLQLCERTDYDPISLRESDEILRKIEKDAEEIFRMWKKRDTLKAS